MFNSELSPRIKGRRTIFNGIVMIMVLLFYSLFLQSCIFTGQQGGTIQEGKTFVQLAPKQQVTIMFETYNAQYSDYMTQIGYAVVDGKWVKTSDPVLTADQKKVLPKKKAVLTEVYPMIKTFDKYVTSGSSPPPDMANDIMNILNKLVYSALD